SQAQWYSASSTQPAVSILGSLAASLVPATANLRQQNAQWSCSQSGRQRKYGRRCHVSRRNSLPASSRQSESSSGRSCSLTVGVERLELSTSESRTQRATKLRYTPWKHRVYPTTRHAVSNTPLG